MDPAAYPKISVALTGTSPLVLVVNPKVAAHSVAELIALAKSQPGKLNFASGGVGTTPHMAGELFRLTAGINVVHVAYRGEAHKVRVHLIQGDEDLRIANIIYDNGKSLLDHYRETTVR